MTPPPGYRLLQVFLSARRLATFEVHFDPSTQQLWCNCYGFDRNHRCRHTAYVRRIVRQNGGGYPMQLFVDKGMSSDDLIDIIVNLTNDEYRQWLVDHGKVVVL